MRILQVELDAERTRCRMTQGSSVTASAASPEEEMRSASSVIVVCHFYIVTILK